MEELQSLTQMVFGKGLAIQHLESLWAFQHEQATDSSTKGYATPVSDSERALHKLWSARPPRGQGSLEVSREAPLPLGMNQRVRESGRSRWAKYCMEPSTPGHERAFVPYVLPLLK